jgi:hypothetical protein
MPDAEDFVKNKDDGADTTPISPDQLFEFARRKRPQREYEDKDMYVTTAWAEPMQAAENGTSINF